MVCSMFLRSRWSIVGSALLAEGRYFEKEMVTTPPQSSDLE
jgi:hypothetical protein